MVWSYPPNEANVATLASTAASGGAAASGNGYQQGGLVPSPSVVARLLVTGDRDNGNAPGGGGGGQGSSGTAAFPVEENKSYKVSVSFDR